jgi:hypothetical protein
MVALFQSDVSPTVFGIVVAVASALIIYISRFICYRISDEHFAYAELGGQVQQIWTHYGFFKPSAYIKGNTILPTRLNEPGKGYGQGQGYKKTIKLIWSISVSLILTLLALSVIKSL